MRRRRPRPSRATPILEYALPRRLPLATCLALLLGCETSTEPAPSGAGSKAAPPTIAVHCRPGAELEPALRDDIETAATELYGRLASGDVDGLFEALHPQASRGQAREPIVEAFRSMRGRLGPRTTLPRPEWLFFVDVTGGTNDLARVQCGEPDAVDSLTLMTNAGGEDVAVVSMWSKGDPYAHTTTITLRRRGDAWRLVGIHVSPAAYRGRTALDFLETAEQLQQKRRPVGAFLALGAAETLSNRGSAVTTGIRQRAEQGRAAVESSAALSSELGTWTIDGRSFDVQGFGLAATASDLSAVVKYVTPGGLVRETLDQEADLLIAHVRARYPELASVFDAVVFEAYAEPPTAPNRQYDAFRVARFFDPSRRPDHSVPVGRDIRSAMTDAASPPARSLDIAPAIGVDSR